MSCAKILVASPSSTQRSNATLKTAIPASAARLAAGSATPRRAQRVGERRGERGELDQLALLELGVRGDDRPGAARESRGAPRAAPAGGLEAGGDRVDRRRGRRARRRRRPRRTLLQRARAAEQHLALVGEVAEERPLRQPGPLGDLRHGGLLEPALAVELQRRLREPAARVRLPATHAPDRSSMTVTDITC